MYRLLSSSIIARLVAPGLVLAIALSACVPQYRPPALNEPHALVKVRLAYHAWPGPQVDQQVLVDGHAVWDIPVPPRNGDGVVTRAVRVRPGFVPWTIKTAFFHTYMVTRTETYSTTESYPCGKSMCSRSTPHTRTVNQVMRVNDAVCEIGLHQDTVEAGLYLLQYDFFADRRCQLHCFQQLPQPDGSLGNVPCRHPADMRPR
jgi:hypothetical protein